MTNSTSSISEQNLIAKVPIQSKRLYAVYDSCVTAGRPSWDAAFIEERIFDNDLVDQQETDEKYFPSLRVAKEYVNTHFQSGAEYYSLQQCNDPDNFIYMLTDKIKY